MYCNYPPGRGRTRTGFSKQPSAWAVLPSEKSLRKKQGASGDRRRGEYITTPEKIVAGFQKIKK